MRIFHSLCSRGGTRLFRFIFLSSRRSQGERAEWACVCFALWFFLCGVKVYFPIGWLPWDMQPPLLYVRTPCVRISNLLAFLFHHNNLALFLSLSLTHFFISLSTALTVAAFYFALFSRAKNKRSADSTISARCFLLSHTGACFDWPLSRELHSLEPMEAAAILYRAKKKKKRLQMK